MAKKMAISFGIGATIAGSFISSFKQADSLIAQVNKRTAELKKSQSNLKLIDNLNDSIKKASKEITNYGITINELNNKIIVNTQKNKQLKKELNSVENQISSLENKKKTLNNRMAEISKLLAENKGNSKELKAEYNKLSLETKAINKELQPLKNNFSRVKTAIKDNEKQSNDLQKQYDNLVDRTQKLKDSQAKNQAELQRVTDELKKQGIAVNDTAKSYQELEKQAEAYNRALEKYKKAEAVKEMSGKVSSAGTKVGIVAGGATAIGTVLASGAIKAESAFADVKKQFDFEDKKSEEEFKAKLQSLVTEKQMAISLEDLYGMAANAGSAGIGKDEAVDYIEQAAKMAIAFGMNRYQASQYMFKWKNTFGMDLNQLKELTDQINILGNTTGATEDQIAEFLTRLGNIPKLSGMAENQTAALGASLIEMGMTPEVAATGAKNLLNIFSKGDSATGAQKKALETLGLDPKYLAIDAQKDAQKTMDTLFTRMGKVSEEQRGEILASLFGEEGKVAAANILESYEKYKVNRDTVSNKDKYQGAINQEYSSRAGTTENQLQVLKTQFDIIKADLGMELLPYIKEGAKYLQEFLKTLTQMIKEDPEGLKKKVKAIIYLTASLYGASAALKLIAGAMNGYSAYLKIAGTLTEKQVGGKIIKGFSSAGKHILKFGKLAIGTIGKIATAALPMLASPITWIILGITALVAAGYLLYKNWDTVKGKAIELGSKIMELVDKYWFLMGPLGVLLKSGQLIYENWDSIKTKAIEVKDKVVEFVVSSVENFIQFKDKAINILGIPFNYLEGKWDSIKQKGKDTIDYFKEIFEEIKNFSISDAAGKGLSWITSKIPGFANGGFVNSPTLAMVGEGNSSEAIIPLNGSNRSLNLWEKTGRLLGANSNSSYIETSEVKFVYSPVIHANDFAGVQEVLNKDAKLKYQEFENFMRKYEKERYRKGYGR